MRFPFIDFHRPNHGGMTDRYGEMETVNGENLTRWQRIEKRASGGKGSWRESERCEPAGNWVTNADGASSPECSEMKGDELGQCRWSHGESLQNRKSDKWREMGPVSPYKWRDRARHAKSS